MLDASALEQPPACMHTIPRIHINDVTLKQFLNDYEAPKKPVIIQGLLDDWPAQTQWQPERLLQYMPDAALKVGADDDGYPVRMKLKHYLMYITDKEHGELDDSPLYIFDGTFTDKKGSKSLTMVCSAVLCAEIYGSLSVVVHPVPKQLHAAVMQDYSIPELWREDLFQHAGEDKRPPYRWFVMGPPRSGSGLHIDPLSTHAWNALVHGHKRWALFPPGTDKEVCISGKLHATSLPRCLSICGKLCISSKLHATSLPRCLSICSILLHT